MIDVPIIGAPAVPEVKTEVKPEVAVAATKTDVSKPIDAVPDSVNGKASVDIEDYIEFEEEGKTRKFSKAQIALELKKRGAAEKKFRAASDIDKTYTEIFDAIDDDFAGAVKRLGKDPDKIIEKYLQNKAKLELMTPEQQAKHELEQKVAKYEAQEAQNRKQQAEAIKQQAELKQWEELNTKFVQAADKFDLPNDPEIGRLMLDIAIELEENDVPWTAELVAQKAFADYQQHIKDRDQYIMKNMSDDQLIEYIGRDRFLGMQKATLKNIPSPAKPAVKSIVTAPEATDDKPQNEKEFRAKMAALGYNLA